MNLKKLLIIFAYAFIGWALCAATMGIGLATTSLQNTLCADIHVNVSDRFACNEQHKTQQRQSHVTGAALADLLKEVIF